MIGVEVEDAEMQRVLRRSLNAVKRPQPLLKAIGEILIDSTKQRFRTSTGPDGTRWQENSPTTILEYLRRRSGIHDKETGKRVGTKDGYYLKRGDDKGRLSKRSGSILAAKKPLIGEGKALSLRINYKLVGDSVHVGTPEAYGAMQHFGGKKSQFKNLWGDIPARPFLGVSDQDREGILDTLQDFFDGLK